MSKLILTRHGQSIWNAENKFTGWVDVDLSDKGKEEAKKSGELLKKLNIRIDISYTSYLKIIFFPAYTTISAYNAIAKEKRDMQTNNLLFMSIKRRFSKGDNVFLRRKVLNITSLA